MEIREAWGKYDENEDNYHPLAHHCMDVAAVFSQIVKQPVIRNRLELAAKMPLNETQCSRLSALVFLHDIGKLHPGFQAKGWPRSIWNAPLRGHAQEGLAFLLLACNHTDHPFHETMKQILGGWGQAVEPLVATVIAHHGRPVAWPSDPTFRDWDAHAPKEYDWRAQSRLLDFALNAWFAQAFVDDSSRLPDEPQFHHLVAGLTALADWIGSDRRFFQFRKPLNLGYDADAHKQATQALSAIGFTVENLSDRPAPDFQQLTGFTNPNPAQAEVGNVDSDARLIILEAETGSGKTEAALWRFVQLFAAGKVSGLYFAVPTRAAASQLHDRIVNAMLNVFGENAPETVLAVPGMLRAGRYSGWRLPEWKVRWDDDRGKVASRWAAEHATRFLAATIAVGTVDQAMLSGLLVKHAHMRGSALTRSLLVVDEVHASDSYMTEVLKKLLDGHLAVGGYAMLMSATLGARARVNWTGESQPDFETARATPYPAVWVDGNSSPNIVHCTARSKTVHMNSIPTMESAKTARLAISAAKRGARTLVIRNTVAAAVETWKAVIASGENSLLMQVGGQPTLHHARFAAEDRLLLNQEVESILKPSANREPFGCIVIGTQTLEQSLDIDADFLITDLCPVDVLLQRIGRLHRRFLESRPTGFEEPSVSVLMPEQGLDYLSKPKFVNGLGAWDSKGSYHGIYRDLAGLELTRRLIVNQPKWHIPEMNRELVEGATHPDCIATIIEEKGRDWAKYESKVGGSKLAEAMVGELNALDRNKPFQDLIFPDIDERIMTRLGAEGIVLTLESPAIGPFGQLVQKIALPAHWSYGLSKNDSVRTEMDGENLFFLVGAKSFRYSREGLQKISGDASE